MQNIIFISVAVVGIMELIKNYLPENISAKIQGLISLCLSIIASVGFGIYAKLPAEDVIKNTVYVVGLTQTSYNFLLKLLKKYIEGMQLQLENAEK